VFEPHGLKLARQAASPEAAFLMSSEVMLTLHWTLLSLSTYLSIFLSLSDPLSLSHTHLCLFSPLLLFFF
jgi:hypothetical protein